MDTIFTLETQMGKPKRPIENENKGGNRESWGNVKAKKHDLLLPNL
jgi:hypothetical protein